MAIKINFIGLVNFFDQGKDGKLVLLPDGRTSKMNIRPHRAKIAVLATQVVNDGEWPPEENKDLARMMVKRYAIDEPTTLSVEGLNPGEAPGTLDTSEWDGRVPLLRRIDSTLHIVPEKAAAIVRMPVARGRLAAYSFGDGSTAGQLTVDVEPSHDEQGTPSITITATLESGAVKKLVLKDGVEIVLTNLSNALELEPNPTADPESHFKIYGQLDVDRRSDNLTPPGKSELGEIPSGHIYLEILRSRKGNFPAPDCPVTGCCSG